MEKKFYSIACYAAFNGGCQFKIATGTCWAVSKDEAEGIAIRACREYFPPDKGYLNHLATALPVSQYDIDLLQVKVIS